MKKIFFFPVFLFSVSMVFLTGCVVRAPSPPGAVWDDPALWSVAANGESTHNLVAEQCRRDNGLRLDYRLGGGHGWVELTHRLTESVTGDTPVVFYLRAQGSGNLEVKLVDSNGSVFGRKIPLGGEGYKDWKSVVIFKPSVEYWWGGDDDAFDALTTLQLAVSGQGQGTIWLDDIGLGSPDLSPTFPPAGAVLDPDCALPGLGFRQRRDAEMIPEDPLVLEWLKQVQDVSSPARRLLPSMENNELQTFNNALVAMAFLLKGERERAERILDFFANATVKDNTDPTLQNFYFKGEPRGFFQAVNLNEAGGVPALHTPKPTDRWMGDMAWLLIAYKYYEKKHGPETYAEMTGRLLDLLVSWYTKAGDGPGGYVRHGWRNGDAKLHESFGHPEGNFDAYAVFKLCGREDLAGEIKTWLDRTVKGSSLPLDNYTWRALAFGKDYARVLDVPDFDLRYRKTLQVDGRPVAGLYDHADINITNSWLDGVGHIACAYPAAGNFERGNFYANQLDPFLIDRAVGGVKTRAIPYTANGQGGYEWVEPDKGFVSVVAWYIFAKNRFNPMTLEEYTNR